MTETMYDGINSLAAGIHRQFPRLRKVAYYVDGKYAWSPAQIALFTRADHVTIAVRPTTNAGDVLDVEPGDATVSQLLGWIEMRKSAGLHRPTGYCSLDTVPAVRKATKHLILGTDYDLWVAHYTGSPHQAYPGTAATQYESTPGWDASMVHDTGWPHRTPPGTPPPVTASGMPVSILMPGDAGPDVTTLQRHLSGSHLPGVRGITVDGVFGQQTEVAVRNLQAHEGLAVDGIVGPATWAAAWAL